MPRVLDRLGYRLLVGSGAVFIAQLPLVWIHAARIGSFDLRLPYLFIVALGFLVAIFPRRFVASLRLAWHGFLPWLLPYLFYLTWLAMALSGAPDDGIIMRQVFFLICALTFALAVIAVQAHGSMFRLGGLLGLLLFVIMIELQARQIGLSWTVAIVRFLVQGDFNFLFYDFWRAVFRTAAAPGVELPAAEKNLVSASVLLAFVFFRIGSTGPGPDVVEQVVTVIAVLLLLMLNSRAVLVSLGISLFLAMVIASLRSGVPLRNRLLLVLLASIAVGSVLLLVPEATPMFTAVQDRLSFGDASAASRLGQARWALARVEMAPFRGSGLAEFQGQLVHNLFLGAWMHGGLPAFLLVVTSYLAMVVVWLRFMAECVLRPSSWCLLIRAEWVATLPVLPLLLPWVVGDAGHPSFVSWMALCTFFAIVIINRASRRWLQD